MLLAIPEVIRKPIHTTQITYIYDYIEEYSIDPRSLFILLLAQETLQLNHGHGGLVDNVGGK